MATTTWPLILAWAREKIAAVEPATVSPSGSVFHAADGYLAFVMEPLGTFDRLFVVESGSSRHGEWFGTETAEVTTEMIVSIGYDATLNLDALEDRLGRDREQIQAALLLATGAPSGLRLVADEGSDIDRTPVPSEPAMVRVEMRFAVTYHLAL